ncbi:hypothetical protein CDEST_07932 [Colletotrichum destructivum]|uniref:Uncharacterized protein n=1 Tax=Colletotrichum destructivum TaxID=34406 RepID=A0AAX4IIR1_9PEZI|nr:hypothetical protein CDEST_07932 [Colletotrichum destructivum]
MGRRPQHLRSLEGPGEGGEGPGGASARFRGEPPAAIRPAIILRACPGRACKSEDTADERVPESPMKSFAPSVTCRFNDIAGPRTLQVSVGVH